MRKTLNYPMLKNSLRRGGLLLALLLVFGFSSGCDVYGQTMKRMISECVDAINSGSGDWDYHIKAITDVRNTLADFAKETSDPMLKAELVYHGDTGCAVLLQYLEYMKSGKKLTWQVSPETLFGNLWNAF